MQNTLIYLLGFKPFWEEKSKIKKPHEAFCLHKMLVRWGVCTYWQIDLESIFAAENFAEIFDLEDHEKIVAIEITVAGGNPVKFCAGFNIGV